MSRTVVSLDLAEQAGFQNVSQNGRGSRLGWHRPDPRDRFPKQPRNGPALAGRLAGLLLLTLIAVLLLLTYAIVQWFVLFMKNGLQSMRASTARHTTTPGRLGTEASQNVWGEVEPHRLV